MGHRCCSKQKVKRGLWSPEEDEKLIKYITSYGLGRWSSVPKLAGLQRCGKSCRLRWINYLRPDLKRGSFSAQEEQIIIDVHRILGNRWAQIAKHLPGRTDNEVKNFWNSCIKKKLISQGLDPQTHNLIPSHQRTNNKIVSNYIPQSQEQTFSIVSMTQHITDASMEIMDPPILTLPSAASTDPNIQPSFLSSQPTFTSGDQNPTILWTANDYQNSADSTIFIPCATLVQNTPISSNSSAPMNPSGFVMVDQSYIGDINTIIEPIEAPGLDVDLRAQAKQAKGVQDMDTSFDSSSIGIELVESALLSSSMCRELSSLDDLAWNF